MLRRWSSPRQAGTCQTQVNSGWRGGELPADGRLRLLSFNIQVGISTQRYHHYLTRSWQHLLPHAGRAGNLQRIGALLHRRPAFPASVNVGFAQVLSPVHIRLRVYERGVGETLACGSGACAAVAVLARRGRVDARAGVAVDLPGGRLQIRQDADSGTILMGGPAAFVFEGNMCSRSLA